MPAQSDTDATATDPMPQAQRCRRWLAAAVIGALFVTTFPGLYQPLGPPGIDPGWIWSVNQARSSGHLFGRDVVFTYGPLGYLMAPLDIDANLLITNVFLAVLQLVFTASVALITFGRSGGPHLPSLLTFAVVLTAAGKLGLASEGWLLIVAGTIAFLAVRSTSPLPLPVVAVLAAVYLLIKMSLGLAAAWMIAAAGALSYYRQRRWLALVLAAGSGAVMLSLLVWQHLGTPANAARWLQLSLEVVSGYSVANSIIGPYEQLAAGVVVLLAWAVAALATKRDGNLLALNAIFSLVMLVQLRIAFVRQDSHQVQYLPFMLAFVAVACLLAEHRRGWPVCLLCSLLLVVTGVSVGLLPQEAERYSPLALLSPRTGIVNVLRLLWPQPIRRDLAARSEQNLAPLRLPDDWLALLRQSDNGVGTLPFENQYCPANDLAWNPTPTLQLYSTYTRRLDRWSAEHYAGDNGPGYLLDEYVAVGKRHQMLDAPATWLRIFLCYRPVKALNRPQLALLERRPEAIAVHEREVARSEIPLEQVIPVPLSSHLLFAHIDLRLNLLGRLQKSLFRVPLIFLVMHRASGDTTAYRIIPGTAGNGVLVNRFPRDYVAYLRLWQNVADDPVVRIALSGPGTICFHNKAAVTWTELRLVEPTQ